MVTVAVVDGDGNGASGAACTLGCCGCEGGEMVDGCAQQMQMQMQTQTAFPEINVGKLR